MSIFKDDNHLGIYIMSEDGVHYAPARWRITFFFAWYDAWVGVFIDRKKKHVYFAPLPCCVVKVGWW